jgi:hypothetical protein
VENDQLRQTLVNQIRLERIGNLTDVLTGTAAARLPRSVHNLTWILGGKPLSDIQRRQAELSAMILSLVPGLVEHDGKTPVALRFFLDWAAGTMMLALGRFQMLPSKSPSVLAFARWYGKTLWVAAANFSGMEQYAAVQFDALLRGFDDESLYLFTNVFHGLSALTPLPLEVSGDPAVAVSGADLRESGFRLKLPGLSLRLFSVNLTRSLSHESPQKLFQLHKT